MDNNKKQQQNFSRPNNAKSCQSADSNRKSTDLQPNKPCPRNTRRREQPFAPRNDQQRNSKQYTSTKVRPNVDKRPRVRGSGAGNAGPNFNGSACSTDDVFVASTGLATADTAYGANGAVAKHVQLDYELNSVYAPGSKKQNLSYLLNFNESNYAAGLNVFGRNSSGGGTQHYKRNGISDKKHKYNKEQFLQANFQFVIKSCAKPKLDASPDALVDWNVIEQINIQTTEEPQCPICLYPPIAAKLTRCGHAYCWPCILHYLALSDKTWRKCPICYEAIHIADLKSTTIMQQLSLNVGNDISFQLMRRKKGSMFIEKFKTFTASVERFPQLSHDDESKLFSKFVLAKRADILGIVERERRELLVDDDPTCPEFVFIQQALDLLKERREKLGGIDLEEADYEIDRQGNKKGYNNMLVADKENEINHEIQTAQNGQIVEHEIITETQEFAVNDTASETYDNNTLYNTSSDNISILSSAEAVPTTNIKYYYFYQSVDGQNIYLHSLNVKMLQACYGTLDRAPHVINARIIQKEHHSMDDENRRKFTCLGHLPLTCQFAVVEVDLQPPIVTGNVLKQFKDDILFRKKERQRRDREERKREKQIDEINDRQMGKLIASTVNINLSSTHEFPTCGFEEPLGGLQTNMEFSNSNSASAAIAAPKRNTISYSKVAVTGESPKFEFWPTLSSASNTRNSYQELSTWGKSRIATTQQQTQSAASDRSSECDSVNDASGFDVESQFLAPTQNTISDVLVQAFAEIQNASVGVGSNASNKKKKNKKAKKMLPLFSTSMNRKGSN